MQLTWSDGQSGESTVFWLFYKDLSHLFIPESSRIFGWKMPATLAEPLLHAKEAVKNGMTSLIFKAV
jgi:hypothetical protein